MGGMQDERQGVLKATRRVDPKLLRFKDRE